MPIQRKVRDFQDTSLSGQCVPLSLAFFLLLTGSGASLLTQGDLGEGSHAGQDKERRRLGLSFHAASYQPCTTDLWALA